MSHAQSSQPGDGSLLQEADKQVHVQAMRKKLPPPENTLSQPGPSQGSHQHDYLAPEDYVAQDEIFKVC